MMCRMFLAAALVVATLAATCADGFARNEQERRLGAFEITAMQRSMAAKNRDGLPPLDAGRGNPNWINAQARLAFARLMQFAVDEGRRTLSHGDLAG